MGAPRVRLLKNGDGDLDKLLRAPTMADFDVFLSYNSLDRETVLRIADHLRRRGLHPWLDVEELRPGLPWQDGLEEAMKTTRAAAVCLGGHGKGSWQKPEIRACLGQMVERGLPVISVLLPGAPENPDLGLFLKDNTWVDLRDGLFAEEGLDRLYWGITGKRPEPRTRAPLAGPPHSLEAVRPASGRAGGATVFFSYSHKDSKWLENFRTMLAPAVRAGIVSMKWDDQIEPSQNWHEEIDKAMASAQVAVLLVSPHFLASDFIQNEELPYLVEAARLRSVKLLWVLLAPCLYSYTPLAQIQAAHDLSRPLSQLKGAARQATLVSICEKIAAVTEGSDPRR